MSTRLETEARSNSAMASLGLEKKNTFDNFNVVFVLQCKISVSNWNVMNCKKELCRSESSVLKETFCIKELLNNSSSASLYVGNDSAWYWSWATFFWRVRYLQKKIGRFISNTIFISFPTKFRQTFSTLSRQQNTNSTGATYQFYCTLEVLQIHGRKNNTYSLTPLRISCCFSTTAHLVLLRSFILYS